MLRCEHSRALYCELQVTALDLQLTCTLHAAEKGGCVQVELLQAEVAHHKSFTQNLQTELETQKVRVAPISVSVLCKVRVVAVSVSVLGNHATI